MSQIAVKLMALLGLPGVGPVKARKVFSTSAVIEQSGEPAEEAFRQAARSLLTPDQQTKLSENLLRAAREVKALEEQSVTILTFFDERYPPGLKGKLREDAPLLLLCRGNIKLFHSPAVGFCGSRGASEKGLAAAWNSAVALAEAHVNVVSGYAAGVDISAHTGALKAGGTTTIVLAEGIGHFRIKKDIKPLWDEERVLVISEFGTQTPWSVGRAMQRNKTICALSQALILVEAKDSGGSFAAGKECLKLGMPLFAAVYQGAPESARGNEAVLDIGAKPLWKNRRTNLPNLQPVLETIGAGA
jgi:DNA processing protein